jgi:hypothetical protein
MSFDEDDRVSETQPATEDDGLDDDARELIASGTQWDVRSEVDKVSGQEHFSFHIDQDQEIPGPCLIESDILIAVG